MFLGTQDLTSGLIIQFFLRKKGEATEKVFIIILKMYFLKLFYYIFKGYNYKCFYEQFTGK